MNSDKDPTACCPLETQKCTCYGNTSTTDIKWHESSDYTGVTEGLATCDTCENALEEWNGFEQKCTDIDECARNRSLPFRHSSIISGILPSCYRTSSSFEW